MNALQGDGVCVCVCDHVCVCMCAFSKCNFLMQKCGEADGGRGAVRRDRLGF